MPLRACAVPGCSADDAGQRMPADDAGRRLPGTVCRPLPSVHCHPNHGHPGIARPATDTRRAHLMFQLSRKKRTRLKPFLHISPQLCGFWRSLQAGLPGRYLQSRPFPAKSLFGACTLKAGGRHVFATASFPRPILAIHLPSFLLLKRMPYPVPKGMHPYGITPVRPSRIPNRSHPRRAVRKTGRRPSPTRRPFRITGGRP